MEEAGGEEATRDEATGRSGGGGHGVSSPGARGSTRCRPLPRRRECERDAGESHDISARAARVMHAMHSLEAAERQVGVDLRGGDVGVAEHHLHAAEIGAVLDHVRGATVAQAVRTCGAVGALDEAPDPLPGERHAAQREEEAGAIFQPRGRGPIPTPGSKDRFPGTPAVRGGPGL